MDSNLTTGCTQASHMVPPLSPPLIIIDNYILINYEEFFIY
jgi:hypothetical protein